MRRDADDRARPQLKARMSYILDALRRADAERERGAVPSIHAQQFALLPGEDEPGARSRMPLWIIGVLAIALLGALAWNFLGHDAPPTVAAVRAPLPATAAAPPAMAAAPLVPAAAPSTPNAVAAAPAPEAAAAAKKVNRKPVRKVEAAASAPTTAAARSTVAPEAPGAGEKRIYAQRDLPDAVRKELPNVTVSGSTYSTNSASRMLMINGQIFHEGDSVFKGLVLQQIRQRAAVFAYKGYQYEVVF